MLLKQTDLSITDNHRSIVLFSTLANIIKKMLLNRICSKIDHKLRCNQNAFRPERLTTTHILILRRLIGVRSKNLKAVPIYAVQIVGEFFKYSELMTCLISWYKQLAWSIRTPKPELLLQMATLSFFDILTGALWGYVGSISLCDRIRLCNGKGDKWEIGGTGISILKKKMLTPSFSHHHKDTGFDDYISFILE